MKLWIILVSVIGGIVTHSRYASALCGVSLPQYQHWLCRGFRDAGLNTQKLFWRLKHDENLHGFALLDVAPLQLETHVLTDPFVKDYALNYLGMVVGSTATLGFYTVANFGKEINNISEYRTLSDFFKSALTGQYMDTPSKHETVLSDKTQWISDKLFAQQRLAGTNPMSIKRVTTNGDVGLDWNKLKETLNPSFDWNAAVQAALQNGDSLEDAIGQGRIYALRYELCDDMPRTEDQTDSDPRRAMWDFLSSIALFASVKVGERNELVPVAIQMDYKPSSAVYTPADGDNWMMAKLNVQVTDIGYAQLVEHLDKIHYFLEPFCVCLKRNLAIQHPLHQMLKFHCRELVIPNTLGTPALTTEIGFVAKLFAYGAEGANRLVRDGHKFSTWEETDFRSKIKKRGLDDKNLIPYFPYRDDGEKILKVIEDMVKDYVDLYYKFDGHVKADWELKAYINELSSSGTGQNGGIGRVQGLPASINSKKELCDFLSRFICHVTIQHAAINYELTDFNYIPNLPTKLYDDTRVKEGEFSVYRLPNRVTAATQASFSNALSTFRYDTLFDYGQSAHLWDHKAKEVANRYHRRLLDVVQPDLEKENAKRLSNGDLTYPYFLPEWLPNGIQT